MIALRTTRIVAALAASQLLVTAAIAQKSEAEIQAEIEFARGLAADWGFVDLAEEVIDAVRSEGVTGRMNERLGLVTCEVYAIGARNERDPGRRNELFDKALSAYTSFITEPWRTNSSSRWSPHPACASNGSSRPATSRWTVNGTTRRRTNGCC